MLCKNCGKEIAEDSLFCSSCGSKVVQENTCPSCGNVYPEGAVFCNNCGRRLDLKGCCPSCGKQLQEDAVYCNYCGKRVDGKEHCSNCGEIFEGFYCPKCGTPVNKNKAQSSSEKKKTDKTKLNEKLNKVFDKTASSILLFGVVFALIFVFLIGFSVAVNVSNKDYDVSSILDGMNLQDKMNMYYYFGDVYKEIDETINSSGFHELPIEYTSPAMYFQAILGTVITAGAILSVVILSGFAIFNLVKKLRGKETKHAEKLAVGAMLSYVLGVISLYALNYAKANVSVSSRGENITALIKVNMNGASVAGIVLCSIALGLAFICCVLKNRSAYAKVKNAVPSGMGLISSIFAVIVAVFATSGIFKIISSIQDTGYYAMNLKTSMQTTVYPYLLDWAGYLQNNPDANVNPYLALMVLTVLQFILITLAIASIINQSASLMKNEKNKNWGVNVALAVVSIAYLALAISSKNHILDLTKPEAGTDLLVPWFGETNSKISVAPAIISLVFALLTLATSLAERYIPTLFPKLEEKKEEVNA